MRCSLLAIVGFLTGCYSPQPNAGAPCPDHVCPEGLVCSPASQTCERQAVDARLADDGQADGPRSDALVDAAVGGPDSPALVQQKTKNVVTSASLSLTLDAAPTSGNVLVMMGGNPQGPLTSVTGGGVTSWIRAGFSLANTNMEIWLGVTDGSSSTVTIALTNSTNTMTMMVSEWSGLATTVTLDGVVIGDGTTSPATPTGQLSTTHAHDLLLFGVSDYIPNLFGAPTGFTALTPIPGIATGVNQAGWYREVTTVGAYTASVSETGHEWDAVLVALRVAP